MDEETSLKTPAASIEKSLQEVKEMKNGKLKKKTWNELYLEIKEADEE